MARPGRQVREKHQPSTVIRIRACAICGCTIIGVGLCSMECPFDASADPARPLRTYVYRLEKIVEPPAPTAPEPPEETPE